MKVSVIIPTYNRCQDLENCIKSIVESTVKPYEIIIVDNASTDETKNVVEKFDEINAIKYIYSEKNLNATGGRILGTQHCSGDYILYIDDDNIIYPDMIEKLLACFSKHGDAGLVGPVSVYGDRPDIASYLGGEINLITSQFKEQFSKIKLSDIDYTKTYTTKVAMQNCFMVTKEVVEKTGGWDPIYKIMFDESDFGMKILKAGFKQYVEPFAKTRHIGGSFSVDSNELRHLGLGNPERAFLFARNRNIFMRRYAPWYGKLIYFLFFMHVFTLFYVLKSSKYGRFDIALKYLLGSLKGLFCQI